MGRITERDKQLIADFRELLARAKIHEDQTVPEDLEDHKFVALRLSASCVKELYNAITRLSK